MHSCLGWTGHAQSRLAWCAGQTAFQQVGLQLCKLFAVSTQSMCQAMLLMGWTFASLCEICAELDLLLTVCKSGMWMP